MIDAKKIGPIPQIGYGTWKRSGKEAYDCVTCALETGYRHIDTAEAYNNEEFVGKAIADSGIARSEIFITTKVSPESFGPGQIMPHVKISLEKLRVPKVDLLLLHWQSIKDQYDITDYMAQFAAVYDAGLASFIGVSNFTKKYLDRALQLLGNRKLSTNQCEIHVFLQNRIIVDYSQSKGIPMIAYSPLARGTVSQSPELQKIAAAHGANAEQVALAFLMAEGHVVIPSSSKPARIKSNFAAKDLSLTTSDVMQIRKLDEGRRLVNGSWAPVWDS